MVGVALQSAYGSIGFPTEAELVITDTKGLDRIKKLEIITDGEIENMCKIIRRPGGINPITNVANLGLKVSLRAKNKLKLSRFFLKHKTRTVRVSVPTDIMLDSVRILPDIKDSEKEHTDPLVSLAIDAKNWPKTMDILEEYLRGRIVVKGVPLYYVVRSKEVVAPSLDEPEMIFLSAEDEMVPRAQILESDMRTATFKTDMMKVWGLISVPRVKDMEGRPTVTCGTIYWDHIMWITRPPRHHTLLW